MIKSKKDAPSSNTRNTRRYHTVHAATATPTTRPPSCPCYSCPSSPMNYIRRIASNQIYSASAGVQCYFHPMIGTNKLHPICVSRQSSVLHEFSSRVSDVSLRMLAKLFIFDSNWAGITMLFYSQLQSFHLRLFMDSVVVLWIQIKQAPRQVSQQASKQTYAGLSHETINWK